MVASYKEVARDDKEAGTKVPEELQEEEHEAVEEAPMSTLRKAAFVSSILFSLLLCSVFLWGLPCDLATCVGPPAAVTTMTSARPFTEEM